MNQINHPLLSLEEGNWFKLICGASFQHLPAVRSLALAYALAGADCIDVAADPAVIAAAQTGIKIAHSLATAATERGLPSQSLPWLMVSFNDGEDPHFRKAAFDPNTCPSACHRPCEIICPTNAIHFTDGNINNSGVLDNLCYGCNRCVVVCPSQLIFTRSYVSTPQAVAAIIKDLEIDAIEIHTQVGHYQDFKRLWQGIFPLIGQLKLLAISCQNHQDLIDYLHSLYELISPLPCPLVWQTDGRPMSGDIGKGTTHAAIKIAQKVLFSDLPGYVQLAGGTNQYTVTKLKKSGLLKVQPTNWTQGEEETPIDISKSLPMSHTPCPSISGVAYGSYARSLLSPILNQLEIGHQSVPLSVSKLEDCPDLLWQAVQQAHSLVQQIKPSVSLTCTVQS